VNRREFITLLGGAAAWPLAARAQQSERMRRIGVLMSTTVDDPVGGARRAAFLQGLQQLGWIEGRNVRIDYRWAAAGADRFRTYAAELAALAPDVILATGAPSVGALLQVTRTVPIVVAQVTDPVGAGFVTSLARPGGNITGFTQHEFAIGVKCGVAQGACAARQARRSHPPCRQSGIGRLPGRDHARGVDLRGGVGDHRRAQQHRHRARYPCDCGSAGRRHHRAAGSALPRQSQLYRRARRAASPAGETEIKLFV
jgi:ABC transporter substrate binding protein